ncbi:MAG: threonine synthase [bacterium]|nr:threonine synthase [bacterium]
MKLYSLNNKNNTSTFTAAIMKGLAPDGGLYYPVKIPRFSPSELTLLRGKNLHEVAVIILEKWISSEFSYEQIYEMVKNALDFEIPINKVGDNYVLELFHGPTMAFKDVAAKILAQCMQQVLKKQNKKIIVLVATSGDTGGAVAQAFSGIENIRVVVLYPKNKVSKLQEMQLTRVSKNIFPIEVDGVFDDCQDLVKKAFVDNDLNSLNLTSANSINIGRLIPQIIYYAYVYALLQKDNIEFVVPIGNAGNITAGLFASKMGLPFKSFVITSNENDATVEYYKTGTYAPKKTIVTLSNAMDVGAPNNFVRVLEFFNNNYKEFLKKVKAVKVDSKETIETIKKVNKEFSYVLDPHTAVAWAGAEKIGDKNKTKVLVSTASPIKFATEIRNKTGIKIDDSKEMKALEQLSKRKQSMENNYENFKKLLILNLS